MSIELISKAKSLESLPTESTAGSETGNTINTLKDFLYRRYNAEAKFLDLSGLSKDSELVNVGMFKTTSRESKFFPALMKVCGDQFPDAKSKEEAIVSVSLADNSLTSISSVTALAQTFPNLRNLDLSNNQIKNLAALGGWRWKFRKLNHLIISGNPIEAEGQSYQQDMLKWYPSLTNINNKQVRSQEEVEAALKGKLPIPILPASFRDEASISENFVKVFFPAYDSDRSSLVNNFYDAKSTFSLSVNSKAPRSLGSVGQQLPGWDSYLKRSRNLTMISQLPAKMNRLYKGTDNIREALTTLPPTLHPDLMAEPQKWCIECHTIPGLQDMTGQSPTGVGGMIVIIHGEFTEVDGYTRQGTVKRSFDRTFVLGPGGHTGIRVSSDVLVLRQYGGYDAWQPDEGTMGGSLPSQASNQIHIETPPGFAMEGLGKSDEQVMKEKLILEMSQRTGLTLEGSHECLELMGWSPEGAMNAFLASKVWKTLPVTIKIILISQQDSLPKQAFIATR